MWSWLAVAGVMSLSAWAVVRFVRGRRETYRMLFDAAHVVEVADALPTLKRSAVGAIDGERMTPEDDRLFVSSASLALAYSVVKVDGQFIHHLSVGRLGDYTANAVGGSFLLLAIELLAWPLDHTTVGIHTSSVHHAEARLDEESHAALASASVGSIGTSDAAARLRASMDARSRFRWQRIST